MLPMLICVWAFVKEIFFGKRLQDPYQNRRRGDGEKNHLATKAAEAIITKMQKSRPFLASVALLLIFSLFINYRMITKMTALVRKDDGLHTASEPIKPARVQRPTIPEPKNPEQMRTNTLLYLEKLYGVKK